MPAADCHGPVAHVYFKTGSIDKHIQTWKREAGRFHQFVTKVDGSGVGMGTALGFPDSWFMFILLKRPDIFVSNYAFLYQAC